MLSTSNEEKDEQTMNGNEFLKGLRKLAKLQVEKCWLDAGHGKGSHGTVHLGDFQTTLKDRKK